MYTQLSAPSNFCIKLVRKLASNYFQSTIKKPYSPLFSFNSCVNVILLQNYPQVRGQLQANCYGDGYVVGARTGGCGGSDAFSAAVASAGVRGRLSMPGLVVCHSD